MYRNFSYFVCMIAICIAWSRPCQAGARDKTFLTRHQVLPAKEVKLYDAIENDFRLLIQRTLLSLVKDKEVMPRWGWILLWNGVRTPITSLIEKLSSVEVYAAATQNIYQHYGYANKEEAWNSVDDTYNNGVENAKSGSRSRRGSGGRLVQSLGVDKNRVLLLHRLREMFWVLRQSEKDSLFVGPISAAIDFNTSGYNEGPPSEMKKRTGKHVLGVSTLFTRASSNSPLSLDVKQIQRVYLAKEEAKKTTANPIPGFEVGPSLHTRSTGEVIPLNDIHEKPLSSSFGFLDPYRLSVHFHLERRERQTRKRGAQKKRRQRIGR